jgi:hypothetical protein
LTIAPTGTKSCAGGCFFAFRAKTEKSENAGKKFGNIAIFWKTSRFSGLLA